MKSMAAMVLISLFLIQHSCAEDTNARATSLFPQDWLLALVSIEHSADGVTGSPLGSAFLVATPNNHVALVTAKHVVCDKSGALRSALAYRLNSRGADSILVSDSHMSAYTPGGWVFSPNNDLAARLIVYGNNSEIAPIPYGAFLVRHRLQAGAPAYIIGFPMGLRSETHATPILRQGIVARVDPNNVVIDATIFPGNSGGPVVYVPALPVSGGVLKSPVLQGIWLTGMVLSYLPYTDVAISMQTERPRVAFEENSGLCNVLPASAILDLLQSEAFEKIDSRASTYPPSVGP